MTINQIAIKMLLENNVPPHLSGFRYLQTAIVICYNDCEKLSFVTKVLYPEIAKTHGFEDWRRVEHSIRVAIKQSIKNKLSNTAFISSLVWDIKQLEEPPI